MVHEKNWRASLFVQDSVIHENFSEFLQPFRYFRIQRVATFCIVVFVFLFWDFCLAWSQVRPVLFVQHVNLTQPDGNLSHSDLPVLATVGTKLSVLHCIRIPFLNEMWFLTIDPFVRKSVFIAKLSERPDCWRVFEDFHSQEYIQFFDVNCVASSCVCTSPLAVMTVVGLHDFVKVSISAENKSFMLIMCINTPQSTTNSRSSGLRLDASKHLFSEGEKNAALFFSFNFEYFWPASTLLHGTSLLPLCLLLRPILKFWRIGVTLMRSTWSNHSERRILVKNVCVTCNGFREFYTSDRFPYV